MEVFATFDIINDKGEKVAEGHKASFCLEDNLCKEGVEPRYACTNYGDQGETRHKRGGKTLPTSIIHEIFPFFSQASLSDVMTSTSTTLTASGSISPKLISVNTHSKCPSIRNTKVRVDLESFLKGSNVQMLISEIDF